MQNQYSGYNHILMRKAPLIDISELLPKIRIHCWGGLGSQLYAVVLRLELEAKYPNRRFTIVCHENGVTRRTSEISLFFPGSVSSVKDYARANQIDVRGRRSIMVNGKQTIRKMFAKLLINFSFILDGDHSHGLPKVRFWTIQVRGHYSKRKLDQSALLQVRKMISHASQVRTSDFGNQNIFVHYRLGDLMSLHEKSPISSDRILGILAFVHGRIGTRIQLFSDSPDKAVEFLAAGNFPMDVVGNLNALDTLWILANSRFFIGTNSKLSIWAVLLDNQLALKEESYLPYELQHHIIANIGIIQDLNYY